MGNWNSGRRKRQPPAVSPDYEYDIPPLGGDLTPEARKVRLINGLTHTKGPFAGQPFRLRPWQEHGIIRPLFRCGDNGRRLYRTCLLMMPRKNGKSELAAALAIDGLMWDREVGAEVYSAAADKDQAALVFNVAAAMIRADPKLDAWCDIHDSTKRITHRKSGSVYRAISAEAYSKHGFNASRVIYDELHAAPDRELWDVLMSSTGGRDQPLIIAISTAGFDRHSILWELYAHAKRVHETPEIDPSFLPIIYEAPMDADWQDPAVWAAANPALGDFRSLEEMRIAAQRAREIPAQENVFRRLYLNQWTEQASRWIPLAAWNLCGGTVDRAALRGRPCYLGMDLSSTRDLTAVVAVFAGDPVVVLGHFFLPADTARERQRADKIPLDGWAREGWITLTPGPAVDYEYVRAHIKRWAAEFSVREIAFDPWNATDLVQRLSEADGFTCVPMRQGFASMSAPSKALEKYVIGRTLTHDRNPVLAWNIANVSVETDATGNIKPSKKVSTERIDGVVALVMALDRLERNASIKVPAYQMLVFGGSDDATQTPARPPAH
jgi:phage terminase large subunit-like protein